MTPATAPNGDQDRIPTTAARRAWRKVGHYTGLFMCGHVGHPVDWCPDEAEEVVAEWFAANLTIDAITGLSDDELAAKFVSDLAEDGWAVR